MRRDLFRFQGHRVFYTREGTGDPIVFLPNATLTGRLWEHQAYDVENDVLPPDSQLAGIAPICWIWGKANRLLPYEIGRRQLDVLRPEEVHALPGRGYAVAWDDPGEVNAIIGAFLEQHPRSAQRAAALAGAATGH